MVTAVYPLGDIDWNDARELEFFGAADGATIDEALRKLADQVERCGAGTLAGGMLIFVVRRSKVPKTPALKTLPNAPEGGDPYVLAAFDTLDSPDSAKFPAGW